MKIGYVLSEFPPLSETFIRREVQGLAGLGHAMVVYTSSLYRDPLVPDPSGPNLTVQALRFMGQPEPADLIAAIRRDGIDHLHSSLSVLAHQATYAAARRTQTPFSLTAYSGHDIFTARDPHLYRAITSDPLCEALVVEDEFMQRFLVERLGADPAKLVQIANGFDLELYRLAAPRPPKERVVILSIARFVEKKGLVHLVNAFQAISARFPQAELWVVGFGPEEARLRRAAAGNPRILFPGAVTEARTRELYAEADIFCLPCVRTASGDADGVPTTILEAMAYELPVVSSNLLSTPGYITSGQEGFLTEPGDEPALSQAMADLCGDPDLRARLGRAGRQRVSQTCDLRQNLRRLEALMLAGRKRRWQAGLDYLTARRRVYTPQERDRYAWLRERAAAYFNPPPGRLLDLGCGQGDFHPLFGPHVQYVGVDPLRTENGQKGFDFIAGSGDELPFASQSFDSLMIYGVLIQVMDVPRILQEAQRVLKPGGQIYFQETLNDPNPIHLNHFTADGLLALIRRFFQVNESRVQDGYLMVRAQNGPGQVFATRAPAETRAPVSSTQAAQRQPAPLVSIAIPAYNRQRFIRACVDSVLAQTYQPLEVVVVDDGSTDETRAILASYGEAIRVIEHERNRGIAAAKNSALRGTSADARYVGILDSDDAYLPRFVESCVDYLETHPQAGLVYSDDQLVNAAGDLIARRSAVEPWTVEGWLRTCNLRGDTWLARRELVMQTRLHDERLRFDVDYDLFYQLLQITTFAHLQETLVSIRVHAGQSTRAVMELAKCHALNLVRYGYSAEYAYLRARRNPEWVPAIEEGVRLGLQMREEDQPEQERITGI